MFKRKYHIQMHTPLGSRAGTLEAHIEKDMLKGYLDVLKNQEPFEGSIDEDGRCSFRGTLVTLMRSIPYTATGQMTAAAVELYLNGGRDVFSITGTADNEETSAGERERERL